MGTPLNYFLKVIYIMSSELPPNPNVNFFNNQYWVNADTPLTQQIADTKYLRFPVAQGNEELLDVDVLGNATFQNTLTIANGLNTSVVDMSGANLTITNNATGGNITFATPNSIQLNATTDLTSTTPQPAFNNSSTHIPTTAWVQSAISSAGISSPIPYYQLYYFINAPASVDRAGWFQFNFTGANWGVNDFFSVSLRCSMTTTDVSSTSLAPNYTTINAIVDIYPNRCPANNTNPSAYGNNPTLPTTTNYSLTNGAIFDGSVLQSSYVVSSASSPYAPLGRWYWVNDYHITSNGTTYPTSSPSPITPYIAFNTASQSAFGWGLWQTQLVQTRFAVYVELINRGPSGVGQGITITSNFSTSGGNTLNEVKVGF